MRKLTVRGFGICLPQKTVCFNDNIRYRITEGEDQLTLALTAVKKALETASMSISDIDCIVSATAVGYQPIPCTAALLHEKIAMGLDIPALDINSTCTSFITALDLMSYTIAAGRYKNILIFSAEVGSLGLNPKQTESFELFSDGAVAMVLSPTEKEIGIIDALQKTWSEGVHDTELRGGLSGFHPKFFSPETKEEYMFDMKGKSILSLSLKKLPLLLSELLEKNHMSTEDIDMVVPHQASKAMPMVLRHLGFPDGRYIDLVKDYGNMIAASIPFALCHSLENGTIKAGDRILLLGTAAGMTSNMLLWQL